ncbi:hypothetical protein ABEP17_12330 [Priestia flexa]|uniref:hypothetical protein n=1 Tax=Priestia flexa TaxID=86664 RepID=UPI003D2AA790
MKFKIFKIRELIYKKLTYSFVFIITVGCIALYFYKNDSEEIAFIISLFYALFLFIISIYINNEAAKIQNLFHRRKEQYRSLKDLAEIYKPTSWDKDDLLSYIIFVQGMTGRIGDGKRSFIRINGFEYTDKYLKIEKSYLNLRKDLHTLLNDEINKYIPSKKLTKKVRNVFIHDITKFFADVIGWLDDHLDLTEKEKNEFLNFIESFRRVNKKKFKQWERATNKIKRMIRKTSEKCQGNMLKIEELYGEMLFETINEENAIYTNFNVLEKLIQEVKNEVLVYSDFEEITDEYYQKVHDQLEILHRKLNLIKEEVEEISINTNPDF